MISHLWLGLEGAKERPAVELQKIEELNEREIATAASFEITSKKSWDEVKKCLAVDSQSFPEKLSPDLEQKIFVKKELADLMKCNSRDCAFNFLPYELEYLEKLKTEEQRKEAYFKFFQNRIKGLTPMDPTKADLIIRSSKESFPECQSPILDKFLSQRPLGKADFRLSLVKYDDRMRPTTRLLQSMSFMKSPNQYCYAEALIFSDHYDAERIELWSVSKRADVYEISLKIRDRIDFLNSWFRRLQKGSLRKALEKLVQEQSQNMLRCIVAGNSP